MLRQIVRCGVIGCIRVYQYAISPYLPKSCRFQPSCSAYAIHAIQRHGVFKGGWMTLKRLGRCHPFYRGDAVDDVPHSSHNQ